MKKGKKNISLKIKTIACIIFGAFILSCGAAGISYKIYSNTMYEQYSNMTMNLAKTEAVMLDKELTASVTKNVMEIYRRICEENGGVPVFEEFSEQQWADYYAEYDEIINTVEFQELLEQIQNMAEVNDVLSMYICYMDEKTDKAVYIIDGTLKDDICYPGTCDDTVEEIKALMEEGIYDFEAYITNFEEYGWLCTASAGIYDENGNLIANAYVDISMDEVMMERQVFLRKLIIVLVIITVLLIALLVYALHYAVISPINALVSATGSFVSEKEKHRDNNEESAISKLKIHTGDEIEKLAISIQKMEMEINTYIDNLTSITAEKERIGAELNVATNIQLSMLPCVFPAFPERTEFDIYAKLAVAREMGGCFYDFFLVDKNHFAVMAGEIQGKGIPAALLMMITKTLIKNYAQLGYSPANVFMETNNQLSDSNEGMTMTAFLGIIDLVSGEFTYVNAGHSVPLFKHAGGEFEWLPTEEGFVLGSMEGVPYWQQSVQMAQGDLLFLYTKGLVEAEDLAQVQYSAEHMHMRLNQAVREVYELEQIVKIIENDVETFEEGAQRKQDRVMMLFRYLGL